MDGYIKGFVFGMHKVYGGNCGLIAFRVTHGHIMWDI